MKVRLSTYRAALLPALAAVFAALAAVVTSTAPPGEAPADEGPVVPIPETPTPAEEPVETSAVPPERALEVLYPTGVPEDITCAEEDIRCYIEAFYTADEKSRDLALALYDELGDVAGVEIDYEMDGGFRGQIHIVPEPPIGKYRQHLDWVLRAQRDIAVFLADLGNASETEVTYEQQPLVWGFFRSEGRTTPSAYAANGGIAYNVVGSLNKSSYSVRELIFHEVFHLNDSGHDDWSRRELGRIVDPIVEKCGADVECLRPYAPNKTRVKGGTWYAFQPDNGDVAREYAAELSVRYFDEQRTLLAGKDLDKPPFKCGADENARAWKALADEFFGGVDLVPDCP